MDGEKQLFLKILQIFLKHSRNFPKNRKKTEICISDKTQGKDRLEGASSSQMRGTGALTDVLQNPNKNTIQTIGSRGRMRETA